MKDDTNEGDERGMGTTDGERDEARALATASAAFEQRGGTIAREVRIGRVRGDLECRSSSHANARGVFAREDIDRDRACDLITIPRRAMIAARAEGDGKTKTTNIAEAQDELAIELLRIKSRGKDDDFSSYIATMPKKYNLLHSWSEAEMAALQDGRAKTRAIELKKAMSRAFERVKDEVLGILSAQANVDDAWAAYAWARDTVSSRAVSVPFHAAGALTPMGDMFNYAPHDPPVLVKVCGAPMFDVREDDGGESDSKDDDRAPTPGDGAYVNDEIGFTFRSAAQAEGRRGIRAGEEIFVCYGDYTNLELLELYGFTLKPDENPQDAYVLDVKVGAEAVPLKVFVGGFAWNDLAEVRIAFATKRSRKNEKALRDIARRGGALGVDEELETFAAIREAAANALLSFPTTAKSDSDTLHSGDLSNLSENMVLAITWRLGVKRIVQRAYKWADERANEARMAKLEAGIAQISLPYVTSGRR